MGGGYDHGGKLEYDPRWRGPLKGRSCTDCLCLIIFVVFLACWASVGYYAYTYGDLNRLLAPTDTEGRKCGVDSEVLDKPYLVFFDLTTCATVSSTCDTPQVCVSKCPTDNFLFTLNATQLVSDTTLTDQEKLDALAAMMICKIEIDLDGKNLTQIANFVTNNQCASWYLSSVPVTGRCIPTGIPEIFANSTITETELESASQVIQYLARVERLLKAIYSDFKTTRYIILGTLLGSCVVCLLYIILLRWFAKPMIFISILGVCGSLGFSTYVCTKEYMSTDSVFWLILSIISGICLVIVLFVVICLRRRILLACSLIREASKAVTSVTSSLIFPVIPWILQLGILIYAIWTTLCVVSVGSPSYAIFVAEEGCECPEDLGYTNGSACLPEVFNSSCTENNGVCTSTGCYLVSTKNPWSSNYMHAVNVIGLFWGIFFISALGEMILAGTFATWYWTFRKSDVPFFTVTASSWRTVRYHMGTLALGSLIITVCRLIRITLEWFDKKLRGSDNEITKVLLKCCKCCFWLLESFLKFLNRNAYIMCAVHGKSFCASARDAFNLLMRNIVRVFVLDKVTDWLLFLGKILVTSLAVWGSWLYFRNSDNINYWLVPVILVGIGTFMVASVFFGVHATAVDTLFLCFLEDCERNDGSEAKPYYMSRGLMRALRRS